MTHRLNELISETISQIEPVANSFLQFNRDHLEAMDRAEDNFFSRIGGTRTSDTSASLCYPETEVKDPVLLDTMQEMVINAMNYDGKPQRIGGDPFTADVQTPDGATKACEVHDNDDGTYRITYIAKQSGIHHLDVRVFERQIRGSPYSVSVQQSGNSGEVEDASQGIKVDIPDVALVGYSHKILVNLSSEETGEGEAKADRVFANIETQTGDSVECHIYSELTDSVQYVIEYVPPVDGLLDLNITINDEPASGNPYSIHVQPASPKASKVSLEKPISNQLWSIKVSVRDYRQNPISVDEGAVKCTTTDAVDKTERELTSRRNKDGDLVFKSIPTVGTYVVKAYLYNIKFFEEEIGVQEHMEIDLAKTAKSFPTGITSSAGETLFVSDTADSKLYCLGIDRGLESIITVDMTKSSQITLDDQGRLLLLCPQTRMVHTIDQQGNELSRWPCQKRNSRPVTIISSNEGRVIIADSKIPSMYIYKSDGDLINTQELPAASIKDGVNNICVDKRSSIILAHHGLPKIYTHNSEGQPRGQFASGATSCQLAVTCTHEDILLVAQLGTIRMIHFSGNKPSFLGDIPLVTGHIYTGLVATNDGCFVGLEVGYKRLVKYGYQIKKD